MSTSDDREGVPRPATGPKRGRLATRAAAVVGGAFALFMGVLTPSAVLHFRTLHEETIGQEQTALANSVAEALEARLRLVRQGLERTASGFPPRLIDDPAGAAAFLEARLALFALCDGGAFIIDRTGRAVAASPAGIDPAQLEGVQADARAPWVAAPRSGLSEVDRPAIAVGVPIRRGDEIVGQLVGRLGLVEGGFLESFAAMRVGRTGYLSLTTKERTVLMHGDRSRLFHHGGGPGLNAAVDRGLAGYEGWLNTRTAAGVEMITAVKELPSTGWILAANYPLEEARGPYNRSLAWFALGSVIGTLALLGAVWVSMQRLARPLTEMTRQVEALATGGPSVAPVEVHSRDEVGALAAAFNRLAEELESSRAEHSRAEAALRQSEERFRLAFKTSPEPMTLQRAEDGALVAVNDGFLELHGLTEAQALGKSTFELGIWAELTDQDRLFEAARHTGVVRNLDVRVRAADGSVHILALSTSEVTLAGVVHVLALGRDVTEERRAAAEREHLAEELRRSEELYRAAVRSVPVVQWIADRNGVFTHSEGKGLTLLGQRPGEAVGRTIHEVYGAHQGVLRDYERALAGESFVSVNEFGPITFESHWAPLRHPDGRIAGVTAIALDISARQQAEARLLQAQKMEAVGRLASGIAHDFNNLLVVILSGSEHLRSLPSLDPDAREVLSEIGAAGERAARLVRQLLTFGRQGQQRPVRCTLNGVVASLEKLLRRTIGEHIDVVVSLGADPWPVLLDQTQIDQVLMNLAVNARDAMPSGGRLSIETSSLEQPSPSPGEPPPGQWACLTVSDTGHGMSPEVQARIFDPFFTTKETGRGTGLGLSTVLGAVQQASGRITVDSRIGGGTTFRLYFPVTEAQPTTEASPAERGSSSAARLTVLAVEDDASVRRSTLRMLESCGFEAREAASAAEGLALLQKGGVDLVLTDVVMPGMSGPELASRLKALGHDLPVVFASGYMDRQLHSVPEGAIVLMKPYSASSLTEAVTRAVARARGLA